MCRVRGDAALPSAERRTPEVGECAQVPFATEQNSCAVIAVTFLDRHSRRGESRKRIPGVLEAPPIRRIFSLVWQPPASLFFQIAAAPLEALAGSHLRYRFFVSLECVVPRSRDFLVAGNTAGDRTSGTLAIALVAKHRSKVNQNVSRNS